MSLIQDLRNRECALINDGTLDELNQVLGAAWPNSRKSNGFFRYYAGRKEIVVGLPDFDFGNGKFTGIPHYPISHFINELTNNQIMRKISYVDAQRIIDAACANWKSKLAPIWGEDIAIRNMSINVNDEFYQEMRSACISEQHKLFDEIFGFNIQYKVGDWVLCGPQSHGWGAYPKDINDKVVQITAVRPDEYPEFKGKYVFDKGEFLGNHIVRLATPVEIEESKFLPIYTPCLVSDNGIYLPRYSDGNGAFFAEGSKTGRTAKWKYVHQIDQTLFDQLIAK